MSRSDSVLQFPDFDKNTNRVFMVAAVRVLFFTAILFITVLYQIKQKTFFNTESILPLYLILIFAFGINSAYLLNFERLMKNWQAPALLFTFDTAFISGLIYITGVQQSIFLFLYLVNIVLCGFIFQRKGAVLIALVTSACFSFLLILAPEVQGQTLYFAVGLNNLAFFAVAFLSGYLSEVLKFMGSEIKTQRADIRALQDINKIIVENINSGLITITNDFQIVLINKAAMDILDLSYNPTKHPIEKIFPGMKNIMINRSKENRFERSFDTVKGERIILGFSISPLKNSEGVPDGFILIFQDLTEVLRYETAMRRQEKLAAVGKLAAGIAHEIRNPLASISGSIELLKSTLVAQDRDQQKLMDIMLKEVTRLNSLITEFLDFVRPEERKMDICDVEGIIKETLEMLKFNKNLPNDIRHELRLQGKGFVSGDKNKLKQVFLNLFINAYQAMQESPTKVMTISTENHDGSLRVKIKDSGEGMSEATLKRLFEPFFTTKPKGTGLGLATVHKILETHEAKIFVESHKGNGTEFTVQFNQIIREGANRNEGKNTGS